MAALLALVFLGVGVSMIVSSIHQRSETVSARVSVRRNIPYSHENLVEFHFADGSDGDLSEDDSQSLFDAVDTFGPDAARVTRKGSSIHSVDFHGKTYAITSSVDDRVIGIISVALGLVALAWLIGSLVTRPTAGAGSRNEPA